MSNKKKVFRIKSNSGLGKKVYVKPPEKLDTFHKEPLPEVKPVQGIMPDSKEEYWVALALYKLQIKFVFQRQLFGGREIHGGRVVDFWVFTVPLPTIIMVQGFYFHYGTAEKAAQSKLNIEYLKTQLNGQIKKVIEVFDTEIHDPESALAVVRRKLQGGF